MNAALLSALGGGSLGLKSTKAGQSGSSPAFSLKGTSKKEAPKQDHASSLQAAIAANQRKQKEKQKAVTPSTGSDKGGNTSSTPSTTTSPISPLKKELKTTRSVSRGRRRSSLINEKTGQNTVHEFQAMRLQGLQKVDLTGGGPSQVRRTNQLMKTLLSH